MMGSWQRVCEAEEEKKRKKLEKDKVCVWEKQGDKTMLSMPNRKERKRLNNDVGTDTSPPDIFTLFAPVALFSWLQLNSFIKQ